MTANNVIGINNHLPWKIPNELQYFKKMTLGKVMIMGKNTFASLNMRALPGRHTIVISKELTTVPENVELATNVNHALDLAHKYATEIMIVGGSSIYQQFLPLAHKLYLSIIHQDYPGDSYFPTIDWGQWSQILETPYQEFTAKIFTRNHE
jgi:dihydrofolate reductase